MSVRNGLYCFAVTVYFIILEYMVLRALARTLAFCVIYLFCNVPSVTCCIFLRRLGKKIYYFKLTTYLKVTNFHAY